MFCGCRVREPFSLFGYPGTVILVLCGSAPARLAVFAQSDNLFVIQQRLHRGLCSSPRRNGRPSLSALSSSPRSSTLAVRSASHGKVCRNAASGASVREGDRRVGFPDVFCTFCLSHSGAAPAGQVWGEKSSLVLEVLGPGEGQVPFLVLLKTPGWL